MSTLTFRAACDYAILMAGHTGKPWIVYGPENAKADKVGYHAAPKDDANTWMKERKVLTITPSTREEKG